MTPKEKYFQLKKELQQAELEWEKEKFMNDNHYWKLDDEGKVMVTRVNYNNSNIKQLQLTEKQKELIFEIYETLKKI